jgi:hypothetical protein
MNSFRNFKFLVGKMVSHSEMRILGCDRNHPWTKISEKGIEVDKVKIEVIEQLPPPINVKGIHNFLRYAIFYDRFIQNFS